MDKIERAAKAAFERMIELMFLHEAMTYKPEEHTWERQNPIVRRDWVEAIKAAHQVLLSEKE